MNGHRQPRTDAQAPRGIGARIAGFAYIALLPPAAFAVHQLRYWLAYGSRAGIELQRTGHSYLHSVVPWLVLLLALTIGVFLRALGRAFAGHTSPARFTLSLTAMWLVCSAALVAIFACQEFLEGLFATGHPAGLAGIFGYGRLVVNPGRGVHRLRARDGAARRSVARAQGRPSASATVSACYRTSATSGASPRCGGRASGAAGQWLVGSGSADAHLRRGARSLASPLRILPPLRSPVSGRFCVRSMVI